MSSETSNPAPQGVSLRPQTQQITPRSKVITTGAQNMATASGSGSRIDSRAAIKDELAGRLRFNDENVLRRLGADRISDDFVEACYEGFMNDSTHSAHFIELRNIVSEAEGGKMQETGMYKHLEDILNYIGGYEWDDVKGRPDGIPRRFNCTSTQDLSSEVHTLGFPNVQPDLSLLDPETPIVPSKSKQKSQEPRYSPQWRYRSGFVEVKPASFKGPTSPNNQTVTEIVQQAADYARLHMAARPFQLFSVGLLVYGLKFCVSIFDRGGVIFSPECTLADANGWKFFVRVVRCLAVTMTDVDLGRDATAEILSSDDAIIPHLREEGRSLGITIPDNFPTFSVSLGSDSNRRWATIAMIWSSLSLLGRGTAVWLVKELQNGKPEGAVKVMKTAWRSSRRLPESQVYRALQEAQKFRSHSCVAHFNYGDDVKSPDGRNISVLSLRTSGIIPLDDTQENKILHRLLLSPVGRPIWEYESEEMLIRGIKAAIRGHKYLYENGVLHRDVSAGNVLLARYPEPGSEGFITDLDYAWISDDSRPARHNGASVPHGGYITGTYQFMSTRILDLMYRAAMRNSQEEIFNEVRDDLESFLWVFCYAIMRHHCGVVYPSDGDAQREFRSIFGHLNLREIIRARGGLQPFRSMWGFERSLSPKLFQWFIDQFASLARSPIYDLPTGFNFTYETLDSLLDTALSVAADV